jgi:hypothetical protein
VTLYQIEKSRGSKVVKKILGKGFKGTLIADFYTSYNPLPQNKKCLAHLFAELADCREELGRRCLPAETEMRRIQTLELISVSYKISYGNIHLLEQSHKPLFYQATFSTYRG